MLQSFWDEAGSYGARVLIVGAASADNAQAESMRAWFVDAEVDSVEILPITTRPAAHARPEPGAVLPQVSPRLAACGAVHVLGLPLRDAHPEGPLRRHLEQRVADAVAGLALLIEDRIADRRPEQALSLIHISEPTRPY